LGRFPFRRQQRGRRCKLRRKPTVANKLQDIDDKTIAKSAGRIRAGSAGEDRPVKEVEFEALSEAYENLEATRHSAIVMLALSRRRSGIRLY
jgi:hypothetical protein